MNCSPDGTVAMLPDDLRRALNVLTRMRPYVDTKIKDKARVLLHPTLEDKDLYNAKDENDKYFVKNVSNFSSSGNSVFNQFRTRISLKTNKLNNNRN